MLQDRFRKPRSNQRFEHPAEDFRVLLDDGREGCDIDHPPEVGMQHDVAQGEDKRGERLAPTGRNGEREETRGALGRDQTCLPHPGTLQVDVSLGWAETIQEGLEQELHPPDHVVWPRWPLARPSGSEKALCRQEVGIDEAGEEEPREESDGERVAFLCRQRLRNGSWHPGQRRIEDLSGRRRDRIDRLLQPTVQTGSFGYRIEQTRVMARDHVGEEASQDLDPLRGMLRAGGRVIGLAGALGQVHVRPGGAPEVVLEGCGVLAEVVPEAGESGPVRDSERLGESAGQGGNLFEVALEWLPLRLRPSGE